MQQAGSAFNGVSFHCYEGSVSAQAAFTSQYPDKVFSSELVTHLPLNELSGSIPNGVLWNARF